MESQLLCPLCNFQYAEEKTPRILTMCGHTFCQTCIETLILPEGQEKFKITCPEDDTACELNNSNLKQFPINKALQKIVESNKSKSSFKDSSFDVSKIVKEQQLQEDQQTKELIIAIKQSQRVEPQNAEQQTKQEGSKQVQQSSEDDQNLCLLHQKPLEVVCVVDLEKICSKCAIFGEHKGHDFKSVQQIQKDNQLFYHDILAIYDEKTEIITRIENKQTKTDLISILGANKESITKQIKQRFKKLLDIIKNEQKKALSKLQKIAQKVEKDIDDLYKIEPQTIQKYEEWQRNSFEKLQIIEKGTFEEKLQLLLIDQAKKQRNIILLGKSLVDIIKQQEDQIFSKSEVLLSNINMRTSDKIFDFTENFVQVVDKIPELPKPQDIKFAHSKSTDQLLQKQISLSSPKKHSQDDLLYLDGHLEDNLKQQKVTFSQPVKNLDNIKIDDVKYLPVIQSRVFQQKTNQKSAKKTTINVPVEELQKTFQNTQQNISQLTSRDSSFIADKIVRPTKKKLKSIKVPQKYQKILEGLFVDNSETLDLTNAELGDSIILQICQFIPGTKIKTIKFIRNKLTDDCVVKMLPFLNNVITLNLSQNLLTERVLDIFIDHRQQLPKVKNIILSLNKIIERKHKHKIDELRKLEIIVSV